MTGRRHERFMAVWPGARIIGAFFLCVGLTMGCAHRPTPFLPDHWKENEIDIKETEDLPGRAKLQVVIVYSYLSCAHTALRLVSTDRPVLFWDPGGGYGISLRTVVDKKSTRMNDLIVKNPPDLETYLRFSAEDGDEALEIFEWEITPEQAREFYDILVNGTDGKHPAGRFQSESGTYMCAISVSDFLMRFATQIMIVPKTCFFPHALERVLYTQSPKRVLVFRHRSKRLSSYENFP